MAALPEIPTFAIVGPCNEGKTTLLATLTENDGLPDISPIDGTTKKVTPYPVKIDDRQVAIFWDTPGFQKPAETHDWFVRNSEDSKNPAEAFIREHQSESDFEHECELFRPIAEGAAVIYLADSSRRIKEGDRQQLGILRRCGNLRIGVIFSKKDEGKYADEWKALFDRELNTRREFNAHRVTFSDRIELLKVIGNIIPEWSGLMREAIEALERQWAAKRRSTADAIIALLQAVLEAEGVAPLGEREDREKARKDAEEKLRGAVRSRESQCRKKIRRIFNHTTDHWEMDQVLVGDLFSEEVWRVLGMTKRQLIVAGAIIGAITGGLIDAAVGGASFFLGTLIGGAAGAALAWLSAEGFANVEMPPVEVKIPFPGGKVKVPIGFGKLGGAKARATVKPQSRLISILIDRNVQYASMASRWSHGKVEGGKVKLDDEAGSIVQNWSPKGEEIRALANLTGQLARPPKKRKEKVIEENRKKLRDMLVVELDKLERQGVP